MNTGCFAYRNGVLHAEDVALTDIAARVKTPFYCYAATALEQGYAAFARAFAGAGARICYAVKANDNLAVIRTLGALGAGADVVSEGELRRALAAGIPARRIVFSGVGKTEAEITFALERGAGQINVESEQEMLLLSRLAAERGVRAATALRINPDVDAGGHEKISTGKAGDKFGIAWPDAHAAFVRAAALPGIRLVGAAVHIGSQITSLAPYEAAFTRLAALTQELRAAGIVLERLDLGGGLGVAYGPDDPTPPTPDAFAALARRILGHAAPVLIVEPGRAITAHAGVLVTSVVREKTGAALSFLITDAAMNDLLRPTLYGAHHDVLPVAQTPPDAPLQRRDVVGPICETGDFLARNRLLPAMAPGALLAIMTVGAYGAVLSSSYNSRPPAPEVMVKGARMAVVRPRLNHDDIIAMDRLPGWLDRPGEHRLGRTA